MSHARTEVTSRIHGISRRTTEAQTESPKPACPTSTERIPEAAIRRNGRSAKSKADHDQRSGRDDFGHQEFEGRLRMAGPVQKIPSLAP